MHAVRMRACTDSVVMRALPTTARALQQPTGSGAMRALHATPRALQRATGSGALRALHATPARAASAGELWTMLNELGAREGAINMGQGFPDFEGSAVARKAAAEALDTPSLNQYSPIDGLASLRDEVSAFYERRYGARYDAASEVVVTSSGQEALVASLRACFTRTGRAGVVVLEPFYPFLAPAVAAAGGALQPLRLAPPTFALPTAAALDAARDETTGVIVVNSPHNPTGKCATADELAVVADWCVRNDVMVVADDVYEHAVFPGRAHVRVADVPGMRDRAITLSSAGKLFSLTGWRVGWALAAADVARDVSAAHTALTYAAPTPLQHGVAAALAVEDGTFGGVAELFARNYGALAAALAARGLDVCPADGGYFLVADAKRPATDFARSLADETGVVCTPLSVFYATPPAEDSYVRFTICKSAAHVDRACAALGA